MDIFIKFIGHHGRVFNIRPQVQCFGYFVSKTDWVNNVFETCNFSFILSGEGEYKKNGKVWPVKGPCVLTQWPKEFQEYGPYKEWQEFFIVYHGDHKDSFLNYGFLSQERPIWNMGGLPFFLTQFNELKNWVTGLTTPSQDPALDRIDALSETLVMESLIREKKAPLGKEEHIIFRIYDYLSSHYLEEHDFDAIAKKNGMSPSTFRRHWARLIKEPPLNYCLGLRIREALRLLVETDDPIGRIADQLRFQDPLYFSRIFKKKVGMTASLYREINKKSLLPTSRGNKPIVKEAPEKMLAK